MPAWRTRGFALLSGFIAALGLAPFGMWPVALAGLAVVFTLHQSALTRREAALTGWFAGLGYFAFALVWIVEPFFIEPWKHGWMAPFALLLMSGGLALFWGVASAAAYKRGALTWAAALAVAELARSYLFTGFPWALIGYLWSETPLAIYASFLGSHGLTLLTLAFAAALGAGLTGARLLPAAALTALITAYLAAAPLSQTPAIATTAPTVRLIQPNAPQHEKWDPDKIGIFYSRQLLFTGAEPDPKLGVFVNRLYLQHSFCAPLFSLIILPYCIL